MKKIKKIILQTLLYTICWRNVDKLYNLRHYDSYYIKLGGEKMNLIKEIFFWWFLIYSILVVTIKPIRKQHIDFLRKIDY